MQFVCKGGWRVKDVHSAIPEIIKQKPHIVILQCGSNDLSSETAYVVAVNLIDAAKKIRTLTEAEVMVCQILQRHQGRYISTVEGVNKFNEKVNVVNEFLKVNCGPISLKYWKHRGMSTEADLEGGLGGLQPPPKISTMCIFLYIYTLGAISGDKFFILYSFFKILPYLFIYFILLYLFKISFLPTHSDPP